MTITDQDIAGQMSDLISVKRTSSVPEAAGWAFAFVARAGSPKERPQALALAGGAFLLASLLARKEQLVEMAGTL